MGAVGFDNNLLSLSKKRGVMMQEQKWAQDKLWWGLLLIAAGIFLLLQNMGIFVAVSALLAMALFTLGGLAFLFVFLTHPQARWWAAIPGCTLLGLATTTLLDNYAPPLLEPLAGSAFLGSIGVGFALVYLANRALWWAIIPGGVLSTLAVVAALDEVGDTGLDSGGVFFIGLGLTFLLVALLPHRSEERLTWAFIPATVLIILGVFVGIGLERFFNLLWPVILILIGIFWVMRNALRPK